jgi:hypothetical protein
VRDLNFEQLFILAVLLVAGLVNLVLDWVRARGRRAPPQDRAQDVAVEEEELDLSEVFWPERTAEVPPELEPARVPVPPPRPRPMPPVVAPMSPPRSPERSVQHRRLHRRIDPREARRGVVLMTILGPCRGMEPPAGNASGRSPRRERVE